MFTILEINSQFQFSAFPRKITRIRIVDHAARIKHYLCFVLLYLLHYIIIFERYLYENYLCL